MFPFSNSEQRSIVKEVAPADNILRLDGPRINFLDKSYVIGEKPIYAIASVDAHGMSSNYSSQIQIEYNKWRNKLITKIVSRPNAPKQYPNLILEEDAFDDAMKVSGYNRMKVFFDPEYYIVRKNLESGELGSLEEAFLGRSVNFLQVDPTKATYKMHIMNVDLQKEEIVNIRIKDLSGPATTGVSPVNFSIENGGFEFGTSFDED